jgi:hypothetical protein
MQNSQASLRGLADRYGNNPTAAKMAPGSAMPAWGRRGPCSTVLSKEEEALIVAFRNLLCALQATVPRLTRSSLYRRTAQMVRLSSHTVLQYQQSVEQSEGNGRNHKQHLTLTVIRPAQGSAGTARDPEPIGVANRDHAGALKAWHRCRAKHSRQIHRNSHVAEAVARRVLVDACPVDVNYSDPRDCKGGNNAEVWGHRIQARRLRL